MRAAAKWLRRTVLSLCLLLLGPLSMLSCGSIQLGNDYRTADRSSAGLAPDPTTTSDAVVQVYAARAFNWRGIFAVHTWIATKPQGADSYSVHQVVGWRAYRGLPAVVSRTDVPDRNWFNSTPELLADVRGEAAKELIPAIEGAIRDYPHAREYTLWPGPNSNTFTAYVARQVPALRVDLPATAIGKDYLANGALLGPAPSGTGYQISAFGLLGIMAAREEGLEINLLGLSFGFDPMGPALRLPGIGRLGLN